MYNLHDTCTQISHCKDKSGGVERVRSLRLLETVRFPRQKGPLISAPEPSCTDSSNRHAVYETLYFASTNSKEIVPRVE